MKRFLFYAFRWQLSTPILAPVLIYCNGIFSVNQTVDFIVATALANLIGAAIFFWVDRLIFAARIKHPLWQVKEDYRCDCCGSQGRCYRLLKAKNYDRMDDKNPLFLCEVCSVSKAVELWQRGVEL